MPVFLVKAASTSSSAFFIEAAAKTMSDWSCAIAGCSIAAIVRAAAKAARIDLLPGTTVLQQVLAAQAMRRLRRPLRSIATASAEPSFQAFPVRAQRTVRRARTIGRRKDADKRRHCRTKAKRSRRPRAVLSLPGPQGGADGSDGDRHIGHSRYNLVHGVVDDA